MYGVEASDGNNLLFRSHIYLPLTYIIMMATLSSLLTRIPPNLLSALLPLPLYPPCKAYETAVRESRGLDPDLEKVCVMGNVR